MGEKLLGALPGGGVQWRKHPPNNETRFALYEVAVEDGWKYAQTMVGKPYDYIAAAMLGLPFPRDWKDDSRWYCSELASASLLYAGMPIISPDTWGVTPRDLLLSPLIKMVREI